MLGTPGRVAARWPGVHAALGLVAAAVSAAVFAGSPTAAPGDLGRGEALYRRYCAVCHGPDGAGDGPNAPFLEDTRPRDLTDSRYMGRLSDGDLYRVIAGGGEAIQGSRFMPPWGRTLAPSEIGDLIAHLRRLSSGAPKPARSADGPAAGAALARELGCPACHRLGALPSASVGPDLSAEGSRVQRAWLVRFLRAPHPIRPAGYHPLSRSRMPDFRLTATEAEGLADYLMSRPSLEEPGLEPAAGLTERGRELFRQHACRACHTRDGWGGQAGPDLSTVAQRLRPGWVVAVISDPQRLDPLTPMPHLGVGTDDARAITRYLFGTALPAPNSAPDSASVARGLELFQALGCQGCHLGGADAAASHVGPDLSAAGDKLKPAWLRTFLTRPFQIRPGRSARMPAFRLSDSETRALVDFLASLTESGPPLAEHLRFRDLVSRDSVEAGRRLASREFLSCSSCHVGDGPLDGSPEEWAPELRISGQRLHPDWIVRWLLDPQRLVPGTRMPSFFADRASGPDDILEGDEERQVLALRDHILSLGGVATESVPEGPP